jgi:hypothetical protein
MARRLTVLFLFVSSLGGSGCMLPDYYHPGGYSSTSLKRLEESQIEWEDSKSSRPALPFRLVASTDAFGSNQPFVQPIATQQQDASPEADPSRVANRRGRFNWR